LSTPPILLIAEREFRTYVATLSFWLSLAIAPVLAGTALLFSSGHPPPSPVRIEGTDRQLTQSAGMALREAGRLEGRSFVFSQTGAKLLLSRPTPAALDMAFSDDFPLSPMGRAMVGHMIERDVARDQAGTSTFAVREKALQTAPDVAMLSGRVAMTMLWLTLTGSLGMLLQAVVRERANRALESLLASAPAWEIVTGKMLGVGAVSLMILVGWLGSIAVLSLLLPPGASLVPAILAKLTEPAALMRDALIYICAFAFYGAVTMALGAMARDSATAQNMVRPMFVMLLVVFFVALSAGKSASLSWLIWLPPFTPFLLLVDFPGSVTFLTQTILLVLLLLAALAIQSLAARLLTISPAGYQIFASARTKPPQLG
jgi:ABC-2 type transport system permease protein